MFGGGAGGGKSYFGCAWIITMCQLYPGSRWVVGRRELKRLKQSVLVTLFDLLNQWGFVVEHHYRYNSTMGFINFVNDSEIILMDLAPDVLVVKELSGPAEVVYGRKRRRA